MMWIIERPIENIYQKNMVFKLFVDSDVLLDLFLERHPFYTYTQKLLILADHKKINLFTSSVIINNLFYFIARDKDKQKAKQSLNLLIKICKILPVDESVVKSALNSEFNDFEDALQYFTAITFDCEQIITRNLKHYKQSTIPVLTAEQFLKTL
jgi:predicted nucleic acid-binding protein